MEESTERRREILLYRCACEHCDEAQEILSRLAKEYGAVFEIKTVDRDPAFKDWAGWKTPVVYIDGRQTTHYQINEKRWKEALGVDEVSAPAVVIGEIVDLHCYMRAKSQGEAHKECARVCLEAGQPVGLATRGGEVYLLIEDPAYKDSFARIKELAGEEAAVSGDICERGGLQALIVRKVGAEPDA